MKKIYVEMVADLFHYGHSRFLQKAKSVGDHLTVGVLCDEWVNTHKRPAVMTQTERMEVIAACKYVDEVVPQSRPASGQWMLDNGFSAFVVAFGSEADRLRQRGNSDAIIQSLMHEVDYEITISTTTILQRIGQQPLSNDGHSNE